MKWLARTAFGLEGQVAKDIKRLGITQTAPLPSGGVLFDATPTEALRANLWLRCADRIMLVVGQFEARSFDELFEGVKALKWIDYIPRNGQFPVTAHCARSTLMSPSDCQAITKKAIVESLKAKYHADWFPEDGDLYRVDVSIHADEVIVTLNSSGEALNRRGYRTWNGEAPLRETLAAALVLASPWRPSMSLYDPCCGTGTLLIEAAMIATDRAPGLTRAFDCEKWGFISGQDISVLRDEARQRFEEGRKRPISISGSDIDADALELSRRHLRQAGYDGLITLRKADLREVRLTDEGGVFLCNPPYGERLGDINEARSVESALGGLQRRHNTWTLCAISADPSFERHYGRRADKKRRFYNGRLECEFMTFLPPAAHKAH